MEPITASVIVPAYNAQKTISKTLEALLRQEGWLSYEIILVDDGSTDATAEISKGFDSVKYVYQPNAGPASARNLGAKEAKGEILVFTDADCVAHEDWLKTLLMPFDDKSVSAVAGSYGIENSESWLAQSVYEEILFRHKRLGKNVSVFGSYNVAIKKQIFDSLGGFDASFRHASGEDNDLSYRLISAGGKIAFCRRALVDHYHPESVSKYLSEQFRHGFWRAEMYRKHPHMARGDGYTFWKDVLEMAIVLLGLLAGIFGRNALSVFHIFCLIFVWLAILEYVFCLFYISGPWSKQVLFSGVLLARAVVRFLGLLCGLLSKAFAALKGLKSHKLQ